MRQNRSNHSRSRSRSRNRSPSRQRSRDKKHKVEYYMGPDLHLTRHYFFVSREERNMGHAVAVWNFCVLYCKRPAVCLIVCSGESQIYQLLRFNPLNRKIQILADHDQQPIDALLTHQKASIIIMSNKKASVLCAKDEAKPAFSLILNVGFEKDVEHYRRLHDFLPKAGGIIISFPKHPRDMLKFEKDTGLTFAEVKGELSTDEINKQIIADIQFVDAPKAETSSILKLLPFSQEELCGRLFELLQRGYTKAQKSVHLGLVGYITYQLRTEVQFTSYKYIWNFLADLPEEVSQSIKNMQKFRNKKGVVFNIPIQYRYDMDHYIRKVRKHTKRYEMGLVYEMPELETEDQNTARKAEEPKKSPVLEIGDNLEILVGGFPADISQKQVTQFFNSHTITPLSISLVSDEETGPLRTWYVLCKDELQLRTALSLNNKVYGGSALKIRIAQKRQQR